jgi:hypothetical protein
MCRWNEAQKKKEELVQLKLQQLDADKKLQRLHLQQLKLKQYWHKHEKTLIRMQRLHHSKMVLRKWHKLGIYPCLFPLGY